MDVFDEVIGEINAVEFSHYLTSYFATFYRQELGVTGITLWYECFQGKCTLNEFKQAATAHTTALVSGSRLAQPMPADLIARLTGGAEVNKAWKQACYAVRHYGANYAPDFNNARTHAAIEDMGGWPAFCAGFKSEYSEHEMLKAFTAAYNYSKSEPDTVPLIGAMGSRSIAVSFKEDQGKLRISVKPAALSVQRNQLTNVVKG